MKTEKTDDKEKNRIYANNEKKTKTKETRNKCVLINQESKENLKMSKRWILYTTESRMNFTFIFISQNDFLFLERFKYVTREKKYKIRD